jgi:hypothetical protein
MATATSIQAAKQPGPPKMNPLKLRLNAQLLQTLIQMSELAHCEVAAYAGELIETAAAEFRARKIPLDFLVRNDKTPDPPAREQCRPHLRNLSREDEERVVVAILQKTKVKDVALRFRIGESTVRRILKRRGPAAEMIQRVLFLHSKSGEEHIGVPGIAEATGVGPIVVEAIIQNYQPLTPSAGVFSRGPKPGGWQRHVEVL